MAEIKSRDKRPALSRDSRFLFGYKMDAVSARNKDPMLATEPQLKRSIRLKTTFMLLKAAPGTNELIPGICAKKADDLKLGPVYIS